MTSINEKIFQLDDPNYISYDRRKQDYLRIAPTTGTTLIKEVISYPLNRTTTQIFFIYPEALFIANSHTSELKIGSNQLEIINEPGEFDTMLKFLTRSKDYEDANIERWIPDTGTGNSVADLTAADEATQLASV